MTNKEIKMNMLRPRAKKAEEVTEDKWELVNEEYRAFVEEFLNSKDISPRSMIQYESVLRQFGWYVYSDLKNKPLHEITKRDFNTYLSKLRKSGMSSSGVAGRKSAVSSLCNYIEIFIADNEKDYKNFRNFTRNVEVGAKNAVYEKVKITYEEYRQMMDVLEEKENYLGMAWLATAFNCGARRSEIIQFKTSILETPFPDDLDFIETHKVRLKGRSLDGKQQEYMVNKEAYDYMKLWVEKRGYESEFIFTTKYRNSYKPLDATWADYFCTEILSPILGRRINPHIFKASCVTYLVEIKKVPIELVSRLIAHHEDVSTTIKHYDLRDKKDEKNAIFSSKPIEETLPDYKPTDNNSSNGGFGGNSFSR